MPSFKDLSVFTTYLTLTIHHYEFTITPTINARKFEPKPFFKQEPRYSPDKIIISCALKPTINTIQIDAKEHLYKV